LPNTLASRATHSSPQAAGDFIADRVVQGTRQQKLNALLLAHHLVGSDRPQPGKEHRLLQGLIKATHDTDEEIRYSALQRISSYAYDAHQPEGMKALRRLVEMLGDASPRVRSEAAVQASEYPSPDVLVLLKRMATDERDIRARESIQHTADSLERRLSKLAGTGQTPVFLGKG
jgi:HEAT repeat protein